MIGIFREATAMKKLVLTTRSSRNPRMSNFGVDYDFGIFVIFDDETKKPVGMGHWTSADFVYCPFCAAFFCTAYHSHDQKMDLADLAGIMDMDYSCKFAWVDRTRNEKWWKFTDSAKEYLIKWLADTSVFYPKENKKTESPTRLVLNSNNIPTIVLGDLTDHRLLELKKALETTFFPEETEEPMNKTIKISFEDENISDEVVKELFAAFVSILNAADIDGLVTIGEE